MSPAMQTLKEVLQDDDEAKFRNLGYQQDVKDPEEVLLIMYVAAICMNDEGIFRDLMRKNN